MTDRTPREIATELGEWSKGVANPGFKTIIYEAVVCLNRFEVRAEPARAVINMGILRRMLTDDAAKLTPPEHEAIAWAVRVIDALPITLQ